MTYEDDDAPSALLEERGYTINKGMIAPPSDDYIEKSDETEAIDYLCSEWDFWFLGPPYRGRYANL